MANATTAAPRRWAVPALRRPSPATGVLFLVLLAAAAVLLYAGRHLTFFFDEWSWILRRRGSGLGPWLALVPTALLLFMGTASQDLLWPFQIGFFSSVAGGLGALALIEDRRSDVLACLLLVWSIVSSAVGIPFLIAAAVALLARRDPSPRLWTVAVPAAVFVIWYLGWGTPMLLAATAGALAFWIPIVLQRANHPSPTAGRYLYVGGVFIWLTAAEVRLGTTLTGMWLWLAALFVVGALIANIGVLRTDEAGLSQHDDNVRAALTAVEVAAPVVAPGFAPDRREGPPLTAGPYLAAARELGTPAFPIAELSHLPASLRRRTDTVLERAETLHATAAASPGCRLTPPLLSRSALAVKVSPGRTMVMRDLQSSSVKIYLRRFAPAFGPPRFARAPEHSTNAVHFPVDRAPQTPWHLLIVPGHGVATCLR